MVFEKLPDVMSINDIANHLSVSHAMVRNAIKFGNLAAFRVGGVWRVTREAVEKWCVDSTRQSPFVR